MAIDQSFPLKGFDGFCSVFWRKTIQPPSNQHFIWFQKKIIKCKLEAINKWDNGCEKGRWQWNRHRRHFNWYRHCWHTNHNNRVTLQETNSNLSHFEINFHIWAKTNLWVISHPFELSWISPKSQIRCHIWKRHGHRRAQIIIFVES